MTSDWIETVEQRMEGAREFVKENPCTVAALCAASASVLASGFAYWRLRAKQHPSVPSVDLPMHHFSGHVPSIIEAMREQRWLQLEDELLNDERINVDGIVTTCLPRINYPYSHFVTDPDLIKFLWVESDLPKGQSLSDAYGELLGNSIFLSNAEKWEEHRKIIITMFSRRNLKNFMFDCGSRASQRVVSMLQSKMTDGRTTVDLFDVMGRFTMDSFMEISFGRRCEPIESYPEPFEFGLAFDRAFELCTFRFRDPFWKLKRFFNIGQEKVMADDLRLIYDYIRDMLSLEARREIVDETGVEKYDLISIYLKHKPDLTEYDLRFVALSMIIAGRDTTRNLLSWTLALLCTSQKEWLAKITEEIQAIESDELSYEECQQSLKLTECVLLETLRLYPSVVHSGRELDRDLTLPNGIKLFKGERVGVCHYAQARNKSIYGEDATEFKPMRWYEKGLSTFPSHVFGAFHIHPRICLGRYFALTEAKTLLFYFLRTFNYRSEGDLFPSLPRSNLLIMEGGWQAEITAKVIQTSRQNGKK